MNAARDPSDPGAKLAEDIAPDLLIDTQAFLHERLRRVAPDSLLTHSWQQFYETYDTILRNFARACGMRGADLDDCVQEVWLAVITELSRFQYDPNRGRLRSWLYRLVRNKASDHVRRRVRSRTCRLDDAHEPERAAADADPAALYERRWNIEMVHVVLDELRKRVSQKSYSVLELRRIDECSVEQVAERLHLRPEQVRARHHRTQRLFRTLFDLYTGRAFGGADSEI
jgi:RNA polymerase sigma-70 factor (ECF subfamily)